MIFFSICIVVSLLSWLSIKLSQKYQKNFNLSFSFTNIPKGIEITSISDSLIKVTFEAQGFKLVSLNKSTTNANTTIDFSVFLRSPYARNGKMTISAKQIVEQYNLNLLNGVDIIQFYPDTLKIEYNEISHKKLPIHPVFKYNEANNILVFAECIFYPDSITITGQNNKIDSLNYLITEPIDITQFADNEMINVKIINPFKDNKSHFSQKSVDVRLANENKIEFTFDLPIEKSNDKNYQYIPITSFVNACFEIPISNIYRINTDSFKVVMLTNEASNGLMPIKVNKQLYLSKLVRLSPILVNYKRVRK